MLKDKDAIATIGVRKLDTAREFYVDKLGLETIEPGEPGTLQLKSGKTALLVYESSYAGTNQATAVTFIVGDEIESIVQQLRSKGVPFEHYDDLPDTTRDGDIHRAGTLRMAWAKDPDGNILALVSG